MYKQEIHSAVCVESVIDITTPSPTDPTSNTDPISDNSTPSPTETTGQNDSETCEKTYEGSFYYNKYDVRKSLVNMPWLIRLRRLDKTSERFGDCTGSILQNNLIITSANCCDVNESFQIMYSPMHNSRLQYDQISKRSGINSNFGMMKNEQPHPGLCLGHCHTNIKF